MVNSLSRFIIFFLVQTSSEFKLTDLAKVGPRHGQEELAVCSTVVPDRPVLRHRRPCIQICLRAYAFQLNFCKSLTNPRPTFFFFFCSLQ